eukprot:14635639-Alexandrium_andersonii.AAC.1
MSAASFLTSARCLASCVVFADVSWVTARPRGSMRVLNRSMYTFTALLTASKLFPSSIFAPDCTVAK